MVEMMLDVDLSKLSVLFIGAGAVASRKLSHFDQMPREIHIVAETFSKECALALTELIGYVSGDALKLAEFETFFQNEGVHIFDVRGDRNRLTLDRRRFRDDDIDKSDVIFCCTNNSILNEKIATAAIPKGKLVNNSSDSNYSSFRNVAVKQYENFAVGVSGRVAVPVLTKWICDLATRSLSMEHDQFMGICAKVRNDIKLEGKQVRDGGWTSVIASRALEFIIADEENLAVSEIKQCLL